MSVQLSSSPVLFCIRQKCCFHYQSLILKKKKKKSLQLKLFLIKSTLHKQLPQVLGTTASPHMDSTTKARAHSGQARAEQGHAHFKGQMVSI